VALVIVAEVLLPTALSGMVSQAIMQLTASDQATAVLRERPAVLMLGGHFDQISLEAQNAKLDKIAFSRLQAEMKDVQLDMPALMKRQLVMKSVATIDVVAVITEEELSRYINANVKGVKGAKVVITPQGVQVTSRLMLGNITAIEVELEGQIVGDGQKIKFKTDKVTVNHALVGNFGGAMLTEIPLLDLKKLPFGVSVTEIQLQAQEVKIYADNYHSRI
jgi:hypothetical protein